RQASGAARRRSASRRHSTPFRHRGNHMQATIIGLGQQISFETGQVLNVLLLRLPSGAVIEATVGDEVAERLTSDWVASGGQMTGVSAAPTPTPTPLHVQPNEAGEFEFGGDLGEDAETLLAVQQSLQEAAEQLGGAHRDSSSMTSDEMRAVAKELRG